MADDQLIRIKEMADHLTHTHNIRGGMECPTRSL